MQDYKERQRPNKAMEDNVPLILVCSLLIGYDLAHWVGNMIKILWYFSAVTQLSLLWTSEFKLEYAFTRREESGIWVFVVNNIYKDLFFL